MASPIIGPLSNLVNSDFQNLSTDRAAAVQSPNTEQKPVIVENAGETTKKSPGRRSSPAECETCKHRKYVDGSDENVSFKAPQHIDPGSAGARVRAHEQEHVSNAYTDAAQNNGKVISAVVSIHTAVCPECGRTYVSGGLTTTKIKYYGDDNAYHKGQDFANADMFNGGNVDIKG
ncbi:MAG: hypothetical protein J6S95_08360 [Lachnospiraceae bacterium]|nr:hypothetical protein [Lachnospiraceae bacterium]MBO7601143.1 hypothetical protein [Lachnospiraceae bacterium]